MYNVKGECEVLHCKLLQLRPGTDITIKPVLSESQCTFSVKRLQKRRVLNLGISQLLQQCNA